LLHCDEAWAAAGTWRDQFGIEPHNRAHSGAGFLTFSR
jgi:hypothetical protein